eukprot:TRINITY_DN15473_c0_g1_i2.p1 TRINITY_DN15473_c0_g1~~TRINITY_DN15473_c0_g1_i2.p1  ORF type:complete len:265 (-),score=51.29 TRINITY_DN15473_c0_g1_i2:302-1096(-)
MLRSLVGSEMCIRDSINAEYGSRFDSSDSCIFIMSRRLGNALRTQTTMACVFDKDGTLLDAHATWAPAIRAVCSAMPHEDELLFELLGFDSRSERFVDGSSFMMDPSDVIRAHLESHGVSGELFTAEMDTQVVVPVPLTYTVGLFDEVRAKGFKVAILTSDDRKHAQAFLDQEGVTVDAMVCGDDGRGFKPTAAPLLAVAQDLGIKPEDLIMIGDSTHDIDCGVAAGARTVGVLTGVGKPSSIQHSGVVLPSVADLPNWLDQST